MTCRGMQQSNAMELTCLFQAIWLCVQRTVQAKACSGTTLLKSGFGGALIS